MFKIQDFNVEVEGGYLSKRRHPNNPDLIILNYTELCVYEKRWNEITLNSRGLIINEKTNELIARCFPKFFNYGEDAGFEIKIPDGKPTICEKLDGSLGISYVLDNSLYWATRGSFESDQAAIANAIWREKYQHVSLHKIQGITLLVEIIDKETRVVVDYQGDSDLILLGAIRINDGYDFEYDELCKLAKEIGMRVTPKVEMSVEEALSKKREIGYNEEGWVLRWKDGFRLKVKGDKYLEVHRLLYGLSEKRKVEYWAMGKLTELIMQVPEEFRPEIEDFEENLNSIESKIRDEIIRDYKNLVEKDFETRKEIAQHILQNTKKEYSQFLFQLVDGKTPDIKQYIYKNYKFWLGE